MGLGGFFSHSEVIIFLCLPHQAFSCPDKVYSSGERELPAFHLREPCFFQRKAVQVGIDKQQASSWFEHAGDFQQSLTLEIIGHMVDHPGTEHDIERLFGKGESLNHPELEVNGEVASSCFAAGLDNHLPRWVNADHLTRQTNALFSWGQGPRPFCETG